MIKGCIAAPQLVRQLVAELHRTCVTLVRNETAMAALRDPPAQLHIGEGANQCCWVLSDLLRFPPPDAHPLPVCDHVPIQGKPLPPGVSLRAHKQHASLLMMSATTPSL